MKTDIRRAIELIGIFGVIASLVFVGMQLRLDSSVALAEQYAFRSESLKDDVRARMESDSYMSTLVTRWERGERPGFWSNALNSYVVENEIEAQEIWSEIFNQQLWYHQADNLYFQYLQGFLDESYWLSLRNGGLKNGLRAPIGRAVYSQENVNRPIDSVIRDLIQEIEAE